MPSERYFRWQSSEGDDDDMQHNFSGLGEEFEVDCPSEDGSTGISNGGVVTVLRPRQSHKFKSRPIPVLGHHTLTPKSICLLAVSCALCISVGLVLGYTLHNNSTLAGEIVTHPDSGGRRSAVPGSSALPFNGRDFTRVAAIRFQSYLTSKMVNAYARRLNRIPESQVSDYVASTLRILGFSTRSQSFSATLSTPDRTKPNTVEMIHSNSSSSIVNQPILDDGSQPYAAYSGYGVAEGPVVYGHRGSIKDLFYLKKKGVTIKGSILLIQHASDAEAAQVHRAEMFGAAGVLFYPDPSLFSGNGSMYPRGTGLPYDGVLSPSLKLVPGDPSTVHYPSLSHVYKKPPNSLEDLVPKIPVQPISYSTAKGILESLSGPKVPTQWREGVMVTNISMNETGSGDEQRIYSQCLRHLGGSFKTDSDVLAVRLTVNNLLRERRITNVHAWLECQDASKVVHIGAALSNIGGAGVGLASLLAIGESLTKAFPGGTGRRIMLSAWAESKMGWVGSTEFAELYSGWLESSALAYLDITPSVGARRGIRVQASPLLHEALREASHFVAWPEQEALSVAEGWGLGGGQEYDIAYENLGCWSDAVTFAAGRGVASAQFSVSQPIAPARCREGDCNVCFGRREEHPLTLSQYDTVAAAVDVLDPRLDWTTAMASLVGVSSLVLTESVLPPVDFKGDLSGSLVDGWWSFLHHHLHSLNRTQYNFTEIVDSIRNELYVLQTEMAELTSWYNRRSAEDQPYKVFRHAEDRVQCFMQASRRLLGPRGVSRLFTNTLAGAADLMEAPVHSLHDYDFLEEETPATSEKEVPPSNIMAIQTNEGFAESPYNNLKFSSFYREEDKPRPHAWFPQVSHALTQAVADSSWENLHRELSLLLTALASFRNLIPLPND